LVTELCDYSYDWPGIPALKAAGKQGVFRYLTGTTTAAYGSKNLTPREAQELQAAGLSVTSNFESSAGFMLSTYDAGAKAAAAAARQHAWCGGPDHRPIYFSLDVNATYDQWKQAKAFLQGCASALGWDRVGMYGGLFQLDWAAKELGMRWLWQSLGWSYGTTSPHALVKQYKNGVTLGNGTVDYDRAVVADWGQWNATKEDLTIVDADTKTYLDNQFGTLADKLDNTFRLADHGTTDKVTTDMLSTHAEILAAIRALEAAFKAGVPLTLPQAQLDEVKAALQALEGSALVQLAVSPKP
jgi:Domain of unknown function (DUF1906)